MKMAALLNFDLILPAIQPVGYLRKMKKPSGSPDGFGLGSGSGITASS